MPEIDRQKALEACRECYANRHKRILQHCRTCVYGTLVNTIAQAEAENDLHSNQNINDTTKRKDLHPMWKMWKDYWEKNE